MAPPSGHMLNNTGGPTSLQQEQLQHQHQQQEQQQGQQHQEQQQGLQHQEQGQTHEDLDMEDEFEYVMPGGLGGRVKAQLSALVTRSAELRELLEENGDPKHVHDQYKTLREIKADMERDMSIFAGAINFLAEQHDEAVSGGACTVCSRDFSSAGEERSCLQEIDSKIRATELARDEARVLERYQLCKLALEAAEGPAEVRAEAPAAPATIAMDTDDEDTSSADGSASQASAGSTAAISVTPGAVKPVQPALDMCQRVAFNMRTGELTELRNQKVENLQDARCFACLRAFAGPDLAEYLRTVDRRASAMNERLHHFTN